MRRFKLIVLLAVALFSGACQKYDACVPDENGGTHGKRAILWTQKQVERVATRAVAETDKLWEPGDTIRIKFQNGTPALQDEVKQYAAEWLTYANLVFLYVAPSEDADVKIGFDTDERWLAWSAIGTDCQSVPQDEVSLNFVWLEDEGAAGVKAEVLRGFGHVLGLGFEHKNPGSNVQFKSNESVAEEYNLSEADVEELITLYSTDQTNFTEYDKSSIMTITIPRSLVTKPIYATNRNSELSELDKEFVAGLYPYGEIPIVTMVTGKQAVRFYILKLHSIDVDWGDGTRETFALQDSDLWEYSEADTTLTVYRSELEHVYDDAGEHTIRFYGDRTALVLFIADEQELSMLDVNRNKMLITLSCVGNNLTSIQIGKCFSLRMFNCENNQLMALHLENNTKLYNVSCYNNPLVVLALGDHPNLKGILCENTRLSSLDVTGCPNLVSLACQNNQLYSLDLSHNPKLDFLVCSENRLAALNVGHNLLLNLINCYGNPFVTDDVEVMKFAQSLPDKNGEYNSGQVTLNSQHAKDVIENVCAAKNWKVWVYDPE